MHNTHLTDDDSTDDDSTDDNSSDDIFSKECSAFCVQLCSAISLGDKDKVIELYANPKAHQFIKSHHFLIKSDYKTNPILFALDIYGKRQFARKRTERIIIELIKLNPLLVDETSGLDNLQTPMHLAVKYNIPSVIVELYKHNSKAIYMRNSDGNTPVHLTFVPGRHYLINQLVDLYGGTIFDIDLYDKLPIDKKKIRSADTLLNFAVNYLFWNIDTVKTIIKYQKDTINKCNNKDKFTPLHYAVFNYPPSKKLVMLLVRYGADLNKQCKNEQTPVQLSIERYLDAIDRVDNMGYDKEEKARTESIVKILIALSVGTDISLSHYIDLAEISDELYDEDKVAQIRYNTYFAESLVKQLIFFINE